MPARERERRPAGNGTPLSRRDRHRVDSTDRNVNARPLADRATPRRAPRE